MINRLNTRQRVVLVFRSSQYTHVSRSRWRALHPLIRCLQYSNMLAKQRGRGNMIQDKASRCTISSSSWLMLIDGVGGSGRAGCWRDSDAGSTHAASTTDADNRWLTAASFHRLFSLTLSPTRSALAALCVSQSVRWANVIAPDESCAH